MAADAQKIKQRDASLQAEKQLHEQVWKDCADLTLPERANGLQSDPMLTASETQQKKAVIYDATGGDSVRTGVATTMGGMVPANVQWFDLDLGGDESDAEQIWLDEAATFVWKNIHSANFDAEAYDGLLDQWIAGWHVLYCDEAEGGGYHFEVWPLGECKIGCTRPGGLVDIVYRKTQFTVQQVVSEYGLDAVSERTRQCFEARKYEEKVAILHAIEPRAIYDANARLGRNKRFSSCHVEFDSNHILREGGYDEFPCMVPRSSRLPNSSYATGPVSTALPDLRTLNEVTKWTLMGAETVIAPPMVAEDDGVLNPNTIKMGPRKIIVAASVDSIKPLITGARLDLGNLTREGLQTTVRKILMADHLPPADGPVKTAYEWSVRVQTLRQMLGPMFGRFQSEWLQPLVARCFGIAWRANIRANFALMGRPPQSLLSRNFTVRYLSPLARAQREEEITGMDRYEADLANSAQITEQREILDVYDWQEAKRMKGRMLGVSSKLIRDEKQVAALTQARQEAQAQAQQQAVAAQGQAEMQGAVAERFAKAA